MWNPFKSKDAVTTEDLIGETPSLNSPMKAVEVTQEMRVSVGETHIWHERKFNVYENYSSTIEQKIAKMNKDFYSKVVSEGLIVNGTWYAPHTIKSIELCGQNITHHEESDQYLSTSLLRLIKL